MAYDSNTYVDVFPIDRGAFNLPADWFNRLVPKMQSPALLLMTMLLVASIGIMGLRRFENAHLERKLWNIPVVVVALLFWAPLIIGLKSLVDTFNTFLVVYLFNIPWKGFGFPNMDSFGSVVLWSGEGLARLVPNLSYWLVYAFFSISFFLYALLGPLIIARGILADEVENFLELVKEFTLLLLWQTMLVILVAVLFPDIVSGKEFPKQPPNNFYSMSLILGIMIFFVPSLTRKFANHLGSSFVPMGFRFGGAALGLTALGKGMGAAGSAVGFELHEAHTVSMFREGISKAEEFKARYSHKTHAQDVELEAHELHHQVHEKEEQEHEAHEHAEHASHEVTEKAHHGHSDLLELSEHAKDLHDEH